MGGVWEVDRWEHYTCSDFFGTTPIPFTNACMASGVIKSGGQIFFTIPHLQNYMA